MSDKPSKEEILERVKKVQEKKTQNQFQKSSTKQSAKFHTVGSFVKKKQARKPGM